jgi:hypothetical protein
MHWTEIPGWFRWRDAQEQAAANFHRAERGVVNNSTSLSFFHGGSADEILQS